MSKLKEKNIIWSNLNLNIEDWREDLMEEAECDGVENPSEEWLYNRMCEVNDMYLEDERSNLNIQLHSPIIVIASLGLWDGKHNGYCMIPSGNIKDCLSERNAECAEWYVDKYGNLRAMIYHHDGTNHYLYRVLKEHISDTMLETLKRKICENRLTQADIARYTLRIGDHIAKVYGWEIKKSA